MAWYLHLQLKKGATNQNSMRHMIPDFRSGRLQLTRRFCSTSVKEAISEVLFFICGRVMDGGGRSNAGGMQMSRICIEGNTFFFGGNKVRFSGVFFRITMAQNTIVPDPLFC